MHTPISTLERDQTFPVDTLSPPHSDVQSPLSLSNKDDQENFTNRYINISGVSHNNSYFYYYYSYKSFVQKY